MSTHGAPVGIFDSGIGGLSILRSLQNERPAEQYVYFADTAFAPYGEKGEAHAVARSLAIAHCLLEEHGVKALVVACNTATAAAIAALRARYPTLPIVGVEPALRPALTLTRTGHIGVMATRGTVNSTKFIDLLGTLADQARFTVTPCDGLAHAIESQDRSRIRALIQEYASATGTFGTKNGAIDTLVLGCTHYPLEQAEFRSVLGPDVALVEPGAAVARQLSRLLGPCQQGERTGHITWLTSAADTGTLMQAVNRWMPPNGAA